MTTHHFAGHMHPRHYVPLPSRTAARPRGRIANTVASVALAAFIGAALGAVLAIGLSGGFRPS
jgi:hypothetical protein